MKQYKRPTHSLSALFLSLFFGLLGSCNNNDVTVANAFIEANRHLVFAGETVSFDASQSSQDAFSVQWKNHDVIIQECDGQYHCAIQMKNSGLHRISVRVRVKAQDRLGQNVLLSDKASVDIVAQDLPLPSAPTATNPNSTVEVPTGPDYQALAKAMGRFYIQQQQDEHRDLHGMVLPIKDYDTQNPEFDKQGDALTWNAVLLASYCMIQSQDSSFELTDEITQLWTVLSEDLITQPSDPEGEGRPFRHPEKKNDDNTFSPDVMTATLYLGAIAYHFDCDPVKSEYSAKWLLPFQSYGLNNGWNYKAPGTPTDISITPIRRDLLSMLLNIYEEDRTNLQVEFTPIVEDAAKLAQELQNDFAQQAVNDLHDCFKDYVSTTDFKLIDPMQSVDCGAEEAVMIGTHLNFLSMVIAHIEAVHQNDSIFSIAETEARLQKLQDAGKETSATNWLFVGAFRSLVNNNPSHDDLHQSLTEHWPGQQLPNAIEPVLTRGCTEYQWQFVDPVLCKNNTSREFAGIDFIHALAWSL